MKNLLESINEAEDNFIKAKRERQDIIRREVESLGIDEFCNKYKASKGNVGVAINSGGMYVDDVLSKMRPVLGGSK